MRAVGKIFSRKSENEVFLTMNRPVKILLLVLAAVLLVAASVLGTLLAVRANLIPVGTASPAVRKITEIEGYLERYFIDPYDENDMADAAAQALVDATGDRWSYYLTAEEYQAYEEAMNNAYVGIGVTITENQELGGMRVESVTPGSPAEEAGILVGDVITHAEGQSTIEIGMEQTRTVVKGEAGTFVLLTILREGESFDVSVERRSIETPVAVWEMLEDDIGYVRINNFDNRCAQETIAAVDTLISGGAKGLIFDLRFNGGGLKAEMVKVLDHLLPEGILFQSQDYLGRKAVDYSDASCVELPICVIVNQDSYSAAEFFAAAIQEYGWGTVVGAKTTGKGNFQNAFRLSDGSLLNISTGKYYTPEGVSLSETGVTPDLEVELSEEDQAYLYYGRLSHAEDEQLAAAVSEILRKCS